MIATLLRALAVLCACSNVAAAAVAFETLFPDPEAFTSEQRERIRAHVARAGQAWVESIVVAATPVVVTVELHLSGIPTATGRSLGTGYLGEQDGHAVWEQGLAHELRTGVDPNGSDADVEITLGATYLQDTLWLPADPADAGVPADRVDALSVFLHEFGHALAYNGWADGTGLRMPGHASGWDLWLLPGDGKGAPPLFLGPEAGAAWGSAPEVTLYNPAHLGNAAAKRRPRHAAAPGWPAFDASRGHPVPPPACGGLASVPAPPTAKSGRALPVSGLLAQLMNGVAFYRGHRYTISALDLAVLRDLGLQVLDTAVHADGFETPR